MSRHKKKTRKQKVLADLHRKLQSLKDQTSAVLNEDEKNKPRESYKKIPEVKPATSTISSHPIATINNYPFLVKDISKTGMLTAIILIIQLILFFLLKNHIIKISGIIY